MLLDELSAYHFFITVQREEGRPVYGIRMLSADGRCCASADRLSESRAAVHRLIFLCVVSGVEPVHLQDIAEDFCCR